MSESCIGTDSLWLSVRRSLTEPCSCAPCLTFGCETIRWQGASVRVWTPDAQQNHCCGLGVPLAALDRPLEYYTLVRAEANEDVREVINWIAANIGLSAFVFE